MSLLPYFFNYDIPRFPTRLLDQNFGLAITPEDLLVAPLSPIIPRLRPFWPKDGNTIKVDKNKWQINVDVQHFSPDEIEVKVADGNIIIEGKHEEKQDEHGFISRQFLRKFRLPEGVNSDAVESRLSSDGVLTVVAPAEVETVIGEKAVHITHTGPVRRKVAEPTPTMEETMEIKKE